MIDADMIRQFFDLVYDPAGCLELRIINCFRQSHSGSLITTGLKTMAGWFDNPDDLVNACRQIDGVSAYIIPNPAPRDLMARSANAVKFLDSGKGTKDEDIISLNWALIDIDPIKPFDDISATNEESAKAIARRDEILANHPEIADSSIWGSSGNGAFILVRLAGLANDEKNRGFVARLIEGMSIRYSDDSAKVDAKTKNPARLMCCVGLTKCKGSNVVERPWRMARLHSSIGRSADAAVA
jgi:hypothetical protein